MVKQLYNKNYVDQRAGKRRHSNYIIRTFKNHPNHKPKYRGYMEFLKTIAEMIEIKPTHFINRNPKENFLLDLIDLSKAHYSVTGDKNIFVHHSFKLATILKPAHFEKTLNK